MQIWSLAKALFAACKLVLISGALVACSSGTKLTNSSPNSFSPSLALTAVELEGSWGLASFRTEADRVRTQAEAKSACNNPYNITRGKNGGVIMHLADQTQPQELYVKADKNGQMFIGPKGQPGMRQDRQIISFENNVLETKWVDPGTAERFGTMVFVRCNPS
jgi:hypothetical protein